MLYEETTGEIIRIFYHTYNQLGYGFLEKIYENALSIELMAHGFIVTRQQPITVYYKGENVGDYFADMVINDKILVELKATEDIIPAYRNQTLNYLKATQIEVGLLLSFGEKPKFERFIFTNDKKPLLINSLKSV
jgi:GxxExxY protein